LKSQKKVFAPQGLERDSPEEQELRQRAQNSQNLKINIYNSYNFPSQLRTAEDPKHKSTNWKDIKDLQYQYQEEKELGSKLGVKVHPRNIENTSFRSRHSGSNKSSFRKNNSTLLQAASPYQD
jgi:hypothetical protein